MHVVAWYLPTLVDPATDLPRLVAASDLDVDGLGVDIESVEIADPAERTRRLLELSPHLRSAIRADKHPSPIPLTPVHQIGTPHVSTPTPHPPTVIHISTH